MIEDLTDKGTAKHVSLAIRQETRVGWFAVRQLLATLGKVVASTIVGSMAGRRELLAALDVRSGDAADEHDFSGRDEIWLDYISDTGDGFDATHSIAWLAGRRALLLDDNLTPTPQRIPKTNPETDVDEENDRQLRLLAGEALILGGDQVYPTASGEAYQGRLIDPFQSALYYQHGGRKVFAIPGNHDWYDGLSGFVALFCQRGARWIGGWRTQQRRSYFSIKLPYGWWLWAVDTALKDDLDPPQIHYFEQQAARLKEGDRVILCTPSPTWIKREEHRKAIEIGGIGDRKVEREIQRYDRISGMVEDNKTKSTIRVRLSGDLHYYSRHSSDVREYIVCGGGGAFALGTGRTPELLEYASSPAPLKSRFPSKPESDHRRWSALWFAKLSPGFTFCLTCIQLLLCYAFNLGSLLNPSLEGPRQGWIDMLRSTPGDFHAFCAITGYVLGFIWNAPVTIILLALVYGGFVGFARSGSPETASNAASWLCGSLHWLLQIFLGVFSAFLSAKIAEEPGIWSNLLFVATDAAIIFVGGGLTFGLYLILSNVFFGLHEQEVFSCQSIEDYKSFLRIHIDQNALTIYPIGLNAISKKWKAAPGVKVRGRKTNSDLSVTETVKVPVHASRIYDPVEPLRPKLIENPIRIEHHLQAPR